jgi:four helix bundle protein
MNHKEMDVWKHSMDLVEKIYELIAKFPSEEKYGLSGQMKRAEVSIPSNIAEGATRKSNKEFSRFISMSLDR